MPVRAGAQPVDQLEQRLLAFVTHDAVDFREIRQQLFVTQARIVPADGEMTFDAGRAQVLRQHAILRQEELEDEREPDQERPAFEKPRRNRFGAVAHFHHLGRAAVPPQHGGQVAHAEIALILKADQRHSACAVLNRR